MIFAASQEARYRPDAEARGERPKMCQGWINGERWEGYELRKETPANNIEIRELNQDLQHFLSMEASDFTRGEIKRIEDQIKQLNNQL